MSFGLFGIMSCLLFHTGCLLRLLEKDFINGATARFHEKDFIKLHGATARLHDKDFINGATARLHEKCRIFTTDYEVMQRHWPELSLKKKGLAVCVFTTQHVTFISHLFIQGRSTENHSLFWNSSYLQRVVKASQNTLQGLTSG